MVRSLGVGLVVVVVLLVRADSAGELGQVYLFKPLATCLVIAVALTGSREPGDRYRAWVLAGLACSLVGDALLMLPGDLFVPGLVAFLVAHVCYTVAFTRDGGFSGVLATGVPLVLAGAALVSLMWPGLGAMKLPVLAYMAVILAMAWQALERWRLASHPGARAAGIGALLFVASDASLGVARFRGDFAASGALILSTYYAAQWLIARSVHQRTHARS